MCRTCGKLPGEVIGYPDEHPIARLWFDLVLGRLCLRAHDQNISIMSQRLAAHDVTVQRTIPLTDIPF